MSKKSKTISDSFYELSNDQVLNSVEKALARTERGLRATGSLLTLNSLENRVYQIEFEDGLWVVSKFYRPQRWTKDQVLDEHDFLQALLELEIPVVAPLELPGENHSTLSTTADGIHLAVFPIVKGRLLDELSPTHLETLGRYLGRIHRCSQAMPRNSRIHLNPKTYGWEPLEQLMESDFFETDSVRQQYRLTAERFLKAIEPNFRHSRIMLTHGDCHLGNTLWKDQQPFFLDFDDCCYAPAVQDIWMIVRGRDEQALKEREVLVESYEQMNEFDRSELQMIEALRGLRILHYSAWIAKRWDDPSFPRAFPDFSTTRYWQDEMSEISRCLEF
ncbi:MAG: serine/threonine protein kinase [Deltaproteobacteria bacterium CG11_big_fil_rev_8_21_14_0_20_45_16]|nr:MAG: serine/threonine protein kinase [Deltaproteobacteria bacterium CG11_big_fil_rev_8_21_14_0_20_45_16]